MKIVHRLTRCLRFPLQPHKDRPHAITIGALFLATLFPGSGMWGGARGQSPTPEAYLAQAREILRRVPLIDGHNDVPWQYLKRVQNHLDQIDLATDTSRLDPPMHTDLGRLREGGVGGVFWSVYVHVDQTGPQAVGAVLDQIDVVYRLLDRYPASLELALSADDVERIHASGKIASMIGMEGGHSINNSLAVLRQMYRLGARYMTLTHNAHTDWADTATRPEVHGGLTAFGHEVVREMNRLGMLVDLSHVSVKVMNRVLDIAQAPVLFSHSSARGVVDYARNVPDDVLGRVAEKKGVVMVNFVRYFVCEEVRQQRAGSAGERERLGRLYPGNPARVAREFDHWLVLNPVPDCTIVDVADHIDHIRDIAGVDSIGLGSDFDGLRIGPTGLEDVSKYPYLMAELLKRGYSSSEIEKIAGKNVLRVMRAVEASALRLQKERQPSDALIWELDRP